jgi:phage terminase small subunit
MARHLSTPELSDAREISFVSALLDMGGPQFATDAAKRAGYGRSDAEAERAASLLLGAPRIARAITGEVRRRFDIATAIAFNTLLEICINPGAPANARITAAQELLNRSSIGPVASRSMSISAHTGVEELLAQLDATERGEAFSNADQIIDETSTFMAED